MARFQSLPDELKLHVLAFLNPKWVCKTASLVCHEWKILCSDPQLWSQLYMRRWRARPDQLRLHEQPDASNSSSSTSSTSSWKQRYADRQRRYEIYNSAVGQVAVQELIACADATDWVFVTSRSGVQVYFRNATLLPSPSLSSSSHRQQQLLFGNMPEEHSSQATAYKCFKSLAIVPIPMPALIQVLIDAPGRKKWDPSLRVCEVVAFLDRTLDVTYARYPGLDFCAMRKISDTDPRRVVIASQSISEEATFFTIPHAYRKTRAHNTQGPPLTPRGGIAAAPPPPPPMQQEEDDDDDDLDDLIRVQLRGTGFIVQPVNEKESLLMNVLQIQKDEWMHPAVVDQIARQRIALTVAVQQHYTEQLLLMKK